MDMRFMQAERNGQMHICMPDEHKKMTAGAVMDCVFINGHSSSNSLYSLTNSSGVSSAGTVYPSSLMSSR